MKKKVFFMVLFVVLCVGVFGLVKSLPSGVSYRGEPKETNSDSIHFFADRTYVTASGTRESTQEIFDEVLRMIDGAEKYIVLDMFLFNDFLGIGTSSYRALSQEVTDALIAQKARHPEMAIQVISDPINTFYGEYESPHFAALREAGIPVTITKLEELRDSNPIYSGWWRMFLWMAPENPETGNITNPLDIHKGKVGVPAFINTLNFKANHRKLIIADYIDEGARGLSVLVTSANPHDGSSAHSNIAVRVDDVLSRDAIASERSVVAFSEGTFIEPPEELFHEPTVGEKSAMVQYLTERAIKTEILSNIERLQEGDSLDMAMFYISDRDIVSALKDADLRGVKLRLIFDPNKDAFGRVKNGIPNRQVAFELMQGTIHNTEVRWCNTHGEQCHSKLLIFTYGESKVLIQGSANLTRRNLDNFNLETDVLIAGADVSAISEAEAFFEAQWGNEDDIEYTLAFDEYHDSHFGRILWYRIGEWSGMSRY